MSSIATTSRVHKLLYFNLRARGEVLRFLFAHSGLPWEDSIVSLDDWSSGFQDSIPAGKTGKKQLPVLQIEGGTTQLPESLEIAKWIGERCDCLPQDPDAAAKAERVFLYSDKGDNRLGLVNPLLNFFPEEQAASKIPSFAASVPNHLSYLSKEIGSGPYVCGNRLAYVDFAVFHYLDNLCTLFGNDHILEGASLKKYYQNLCQLPAISERIKTRPQAGCGAVGAPASILFKHNDPSKLDFVQKAWREKDDA